MWYLALLLLFAGWAQAQTAPSPQPLPYAQTFGTEAFSQLPDGWAAWTVATAPRNSLANAESSVPNGDATLTSRTSVTNTGGVYGLATDENARLYIQTSGSSTSQPVLALNTEGFTAITLTYSVEIIVAEVREVGMVAQYRVGSSGAWTTIPGTNAFSQAGGTTGVKVTRELTLPQDAENQPVVQIRWAVWRGGSSGNSSGIALDNVSVTGQQGQVARFQFTTSGATVTEGQSSAYTVRLVTSDAQPLEQETTVEVRFGASSTASRTADFDPAQPASRILTFPATSASGSMQEVSLATADRSGLMRSAVFELVAPAGAGLLAPETFTLEIEGTGQPATVQFDAETLTAFDGGELSLLVRLSTSDGQPNPFERTALVSLQTGSASAFTPTFTTQTLTFPIGHADGAGVGLDLQLAHRDLNIPDTLVFAVQAGAGTSVGATGTQRVAVRPLCIAPCLVQYSFAGTSGVTAQRAAGRVHNSVTASAVQRAGVNGSSASNAFSSNGWNTASLDPARYYSFTISPEAVQVEKTRLQFSHARSGTGPTQFAIRTSRDGFSTNVFEGTLEGTASMAVDLDLTHPDVARFFRDVIEPITVRLYAWGASAGTGTYRLDQTLRIEGNVQSRPALAREVGGPQPGWRMMAAPVSGMRVSDLAAFSLVQGVPDAFPTHGRNLFVGYVGNSADQSDGRSNGFVPALALNTSLESGRGFLWYKWPTPVRVSGQEVGRGLPLVVSSAGSSPDGPVQVSFTTAERSTPDDGFFLLGNPYGTAFPLCGVTASQGTLSAQFSAWDANSGGYATLDESQDVAPWTGFFAQVSGANLAESPLTFTLTPGPCAPGKQNAIALTYRLVLEGQMLGTPFRSEARLVLSDEASAGWDRWDASALAPLQGRFAQVAFGGEQGGRQSSASFPLGEPLALPLSLRATHEAEEVRLTIYPPAERPEGLRVRVQDLELGTTTEVQSTTELTFPVGAQVWAERFRLVATYGEATSTSRDTPTDTFVGDAFPRPAASRVSIPVNAPSASTWTAEVYDLTGRVLQRTEHAVASGASMLHVGVSSLPPGVYPVRMESALGTFTRLLVVAR